MTERTPGAGDAGDGAARLIPPGSEALVGRDGDLAVVHAFLDEARRAGAALLVRGEPGVGKSLVLEAAADRAATAGTRVVRATGTEFEAQVSFSGLDRLLTPLHAGFRQLTPVYQAALSVALGLGDGPTPDRLVVSNAALELLRVSARERPLLLVVDDGQWLDWASTVVLGFVGRRLTGIPVGLLAALRPGSADALARAGLPEHELGPLDGQSASRLLSRSFPGLAASVHHRVLAEAEGNPLALTELPTALTGAQRAAEQALPPVLPVSRRLAAVFGSRVLQLPAPTRRLLLLAALQGAGELAILNAAARGSQGLDALAPAERSGLVSSRADSSRLAFRHPLVRSTVVEVSTAIERRRAHRALAEALSDQPDRRAWHLAEATVEADEEVAALLEDTARTSLRRGDSVGAVAALTRAADLSPDPSHRERRRAEAAYISADVTGELTDATQFLADPLRGGATAGPFLQSAVAASYLLLHDDGDVNGAHRVLVAAVERHLAEAGEVDPSIEEALHTLLLVCFWGGRAELWPPFEAAVHRYGDRLPDTLTLCFATLADPVRTAVPALPAVEAAITGLRDVVDPTRIVRIGIAAFYVDRLSGCSEAFRRVVDDGRRGGAVASAIDATMLLCFERWAAGGWEEARGWADEGVALGESHGYRLLTWPGRLARALLAAVHGDAATAETLAREMTAWAAPRGVGMVLVYASHARALAAIARGDFEAAYQQATGINPPGVIASHVAHAVWVALDLVEAAVRTGRRAEATAHVAAMRATDMAAISPRAALIVAGAAAMAADPDVARDRFEEALALPGTNRWPFELARVKLAYGEHLRREHDLVASRQQLAGALEIFQRLGAHPWSARAAGHLRPAARIRPPGPARLSPAEWEIATLAASGLTNKQIAERLYLSHRTVAARLYQLFPKLGITSRAALRDALARLPEAPDHRPPTGLDAPRPPSD